VIPASVTIRLLPVSQTKDVILKALNIGAVIFLMGLSGCVSPLKTGIRSYYEGIPVEGQVAESSIVSKHAPKNQLSQELTGGSSIQVTINTSTRPYPEEDALPVALPNPLEEAFPNAQVMVRGRNRSSSITVDPSLIVLDVAGVRHTPVEFPPDVMMPRGPHSKATVYSTDIVTFSYDRGFAKKWGNRLAYRLRTQRYSDAEVIFLPGALTVDGQLMPQLSFQFEFVRREHSYRINYR
jgi:hypothetical protein